MKNQYRYYISHLMHTNFIQSKRKFCFLSFVLFSLSILGQTKVDSLENLLSNLNEDTNKVNILNLLAWELNSSNTGKSLAYAKQALTLAQRLKFNSGLIRAHNNVGIAYYFQGSYPDALSNYLEAIKLLEKTKDKKKLSATCNNIAAIYLGLKNYKDAETYFNRSLKIDLELGDKAGEAESYNNIGIIYHEQNKEDEALDFYFKSLRIRESINDLAGLPSTLSNIGNALVAKQDYKQAEEYITKAMRAYKANGDSMGVALGFTNLGDLFMEQNFYKNAMYYFDSSLTISKKNNYLDYLSYDYKMLAVANSKLGNFEKAYEYHQLYAIAKDTMYNKDNSLQVAEMQTKYETEVKEKEIISSKAESEKQTAMRNLFVIGFCLMIILSVFIFRGYKGKKQAHLIISGQKKEVERQKLIVENQKELVEEKNKEVLDSIYYARRIQRALLTSEAYIKKHLNADFFILFKPKDIVSGDFYWAVEHNNLFFMMTADCTGHGVPGAFMSMLGINYLNEIIIERNIKNPALILDILREEIIRNLNPEGAEEAKDGMDATLCVYDMHNKTLDFAAANNPLWLNRNGVITEYKADKMPVGKYLEDALGFTRQTIELEAGDTIYTFTDGYADQFGGDKGKKFKYKPLKEMLSANTNKPMKEQKNLLDKTFEDWRDKLAQVDDVLVIGIRI